MRRALWGLVIGVGLVTVILLLLDIKRVITVLRSARAGPLGLAAALGIFGIALLATALYWLRMALDPAEGGSVPRFYLAWLNGLFVRLLLPVGSSGAPAIFAYVLSREFDMPFEEELAVATAAELLNYLAAASVALVGAGAFLGAGGQLAYAGPVLGTLAAVIAVAGAGLTTLLYRPATVDWIVRSAAAGIRRTVGRLSDRIRFAVTEERVEARLRSVHQTTELLRNAPGAVGVGLVLSALAWLATTLSLWAAAAALGANVPVALALVAVPLSGFAYILPVSGGLGGVEVTIGTLLVVGSGIGVHVAAAAVLLFRLATFWLPLAGAGIATALHPVELPAGF